MSSGWPGAPGAQGGTAQSCPNLGEGRRRRSDTDAGIEVGTSSQDITEASPGESHILRKLPYIQATFKLWNGCHELGHGKELPCPPSGYCAERRILLPEQLLNLEALQARGSPPASHASGAACHPQGLAKCTPPSGPGSFAKAPGTAPGPHRGPVPTSGAKHRKLTHLEEPHPQRPRTSKQGQENISPQGAPTCTSPKSRRPSMTPVQCFTCLTVFTVEPCTPYVQLFLSLKSSKQTIKQNTFYPLSLRSTPPCRTGGAGPECGQSGSHPQPTPVSFYQPPLLGIRPPCRGLVHTPRDTSPVFQSLPRPVPSPHLLPGARSGHPTAQSVGALGRGLRRPEAGWSPCQEAPRSRTNGR